MRLHTQTALYWQSTDGHAADLLGHLERQAQPSGEVTVYLSAKVRLPVRLIYCRVPEPQVAKKRRGAPTPCQRKPPRLLRPPFTLLGLADLCDQCPRHSLVGSPSAGRLSPALAN